MSPSKFDSTIIAEGKASAQAEAAEWKRKYELERARNLQMECKEHDSDVDDARMGNLVNQPVWCSEANEQFEKCCRNGLCSHEVLRDGETDFDSKMVKKASFKLSWCCKGQQSDQYKHDIVPFERGNITIAERSSKQISLRWESHPQTVLILTKPNSISVQVLCAEMVRWLREQKKLDIYVEPRVRVELLTSVLYKHGKMAASMFKGPVPPIVPFSLGSLGFITPFHSENYRECLDSVFRGPISITLRHRLQCHVIRDVAKNENDSEEPILVLKEVTIDRGIS